MASLPTSEPIIKLTDPSGAPIPGLEEWVDGEIEVRVRRTEVQLLRLYLNGERLLFGVRFDADGNERIVADWKRRGAGNYLIDLKRLDQGGALRDVESKRIQVWPRKISRGAFGTLLSETESLLPAKIAIALKRYGGLAGVELLSPSETTLAQEQERLRQAVEGGRERMGLLDVLNDLAKNPYRRLRSIDVWSPIHAARHPDATHLSQAMRRPGNLDVTGLPQRVLDRRVEHTSDVYENRVVRSYVLEVEQRLRRLERALAPRATGEENGDSAHQACSERLKLLEAAHVECAAVNEAVGSIHEGIRVSMVMARRPAYRAVFKGLEDLRRSLSVRLDDPGIEAPLENLPWLYQVWTTLIVVFSLMEYAGSIRFEMTSCSMVEHQPDGVFVRVLPRGSPVLELMSRGNGTRILVIPERSYYREGDLVSVSYLQRPDLAIEIRPTDAPPSVLVFDAKYKLDSEADGTLRPQPQDTDIKTMHAYSDAIRTRDHVQVVKHAAILYPGAHFAYGASIEALPALPGESEDQPSTTAPILQKRLGEIWKEHIG
jgi:hypothetical protein